MHIVRRRASLRCAAPFCGFPRRLLLRVVQIRIYFRADFFKLPEIFVVHLPALPHSDVRDGEFQCGHRQIVLVVPVLDILLFYQCEVAVHLPFGKPVYLLFPALDMNG